MKKFALFCAIIFCCLTCFAQNNDKIYNQYIDAARKGDPVAQYHIGFWNYDNGQKSSAIYWWKKAAQQLDGDACYAVTLCYLNEEGVSFDADSLFQYAYFGYYAQHPESTFLLGKLTLISGDTTQATAYIQNAIDLGCEEAKEFYNENLRGERLPLSTANDINRNELLELANHWNKRTPLEVDLGLTLVKYTYKNNEFVYSYIVDEDIIDFSILEENLKEIDKNPIFLKEDVEQTPNRLIFYKALVRNNTNLVYLYKSSISGKVLSVIISPKEIKQILKL